MLTPLYTKKFEKDLKLLLKRGKNGTKIKSIIETLIDQRELDAKHRNHKLIGNYTGRYECHIEADWLLIYKLENSRIIFERTGTHSDLFD